jgi:hypothetical protein
MSLFETYLEAARSADKNKEDVSIKEQFILKQIKKADDEGLLEIAHYVLGDLGDYGDQEEIDSMDLDKLYDDLVETIKKATSKEINRLYDLLK